MENKKEVTIKELLSNIVPEKIKDYYSWIDVECEEISNKEEMIECINKLILKGYGYK